MLVAEKYYSKNEFGPWSMGKLARKKIFAIPDFYLCALRIIIHGFPRARKNVKKGAGAYGYLKKNDKVTRWEKKF